MLEYVAKLSANPAAIVASDIEALREVGFDDHAIGDIALNAAVFEMINRIVDGLGGRPPDVSIRRAATLGILSWSEEPWASEAG
jgi:alkylhydroperoxidase family enzyme